MRKGKDGILRVQDTPHCVKCKADLSGSFLESELGVFPVCELSGATIEIVCPDCMTEQNISPIIQWQTWE